MKAKITFILVFSFLFLGFKFVSAEVIINEIQISPTDGRFIELYNSGISDVDLTDWYLQRKTQNGTEFSSLVSKPNFENKVISAGGYFLISRSVMNEADIILENLTLTESNTIQIKNSNQEVVDKVGWGEANDCNGSCAPNPTDGNSIQKTSDGWIVAIPTPRAPNENNPVVNPPPAGDTGGGNTSTTSPEPKVKVVETPTIKAKILVNKLAFVGQPFEMKTNVLGYSNENVVLGRIFWNFGDGSSFQQINDFQKFYHTYYYPGEYVVFSEYYQNNFSEIPDATNKMTIKVLPTTVVISKIGDVKDFFVELTNDASSDIDISNWIIKAGMKTFTLPKNSVILAKKQMTIPGKITGFTFGDQYNLRLLSSTGELIFDYNNKYIPIRSSFIQAKEEVPVSVSSTPVDSGLQNEKSNLSTDLAAAPVLNEIEKNSNSQNSYLFFWGFVVLLIISSGMVYYIRRGKNDSKIGDDFKIIDE